MGIYDVTIVVAWVLVVITLAIAGVIMIGADWREVWLNFSRRMLRLGRSLNRY